MGSIEVILNLFRDNTFCSIFISCSLVNELLHIESRVLNYKPINRSVTSALLNELHTLINGLTLFILIEIHNMVSANN